MYIYIYIYALQYDYIPPTRHAVPSPCSPWTSLPPTAWRRPPSHLPDRGRCQSSEGGAINRVMHTSAAPRWKVRWDMTGLWNWSGWNTVNRWTWKIMPSSLYLWVSFLLRCRYYSSISCRILPCLPLSGRYCDSFYIYIYDTSNESKVVPILEHVNIMPTRSGWQKVAEQASSEKWTSASWQKETSSHEYGSPLETTALSFFNQCMFSP